MNKLLIKNELEHGKTYNCILSSFNFVCNHIPVKGIETQQGVVVTDFDIKMRYFNPSTGFYADVAPFDYQFFENERI